MLFDLFKATVLGIVEGLTEFLPVSSTGHLLLMEHFFGFDDDEFGKAFVVLIQLGAILALLSIYFVRLWNIALALPSDPEARRFVIGVLIAFLPAALIGALAYSIIKGVLFNVWIVCTMLIIGGFVLLWIDRLDLKARHHDATKFPFWLAMPTMAGAFVYEVYKSRADLSGAKPLIVAVGFITSFIAGWIVVKTFLDY